ncbi:FCD domain-containing protein [Pontibacter sp. G13]|uniref:FadR/GntR family transcriptional regulator n=1 Tax=Pontibacter sp. G13 TaxID=3074898 RepID=UPI00288B45DC|nr:FCD domain-containing protein [Pontibacter sp. G13]WNJ20478.1 FCD domain-containing protein [Pontibacter sp. G13]
MDISGSANVGKRVFQEISMEKPSDKIIQQIRHLIKSGQLNPGDKLPAERQLVDSFGVGRGHVREALKKLEFYGILKTMPQSGTVVAGIGVNALEGLITNVLHIETPDFQSLIETRLMLEMNAARWAARRRTAQDLVELEEALARYQDRVLADEPGVEEDMLFHLKIAEVSKNSVLNTLSTIVTPDMIHYSLKLKICDNGRFRKALTEHELILDRIRAQDEEGAALAMKAHLQDVVDAAFEEDIALD